MAEFSSQEDTVEHVRVDDVEGLPQYLLSQRYEGAMPLQAVCQVGELSQHVLCGEVGGVT